ncbi:MAG: Crp/Fnr family transcriptional regulator [Bacteroidetes bacterium]|nr:Crp/Fnr family transcriptional regulator [Bacteroidota bacterium]
MQEGTKLWYLENFNLFEGMKSSEMMKLGEMTSMRSITKRQHIYFPDDPSKTIFFLKKGRVKLGSYTEDGKEMIKFILNPGEIFGELGLAGEEKRTDFAEALDDDTMLCAVGVRDMEMMMEMNPKLNLKVTKLIGFRLRKIERRLESMFFKDVRTRIIDFLKELAEDKGRKLGQEIVVEHRLTHQDIANLTATSRQTVTTILNELKEKNLIHINRKSLIIRSIDKLK